METKKSMINSRFLVKATTLAAVVFAFGVSAARATLMLTISDGIAADTVTVSDNGTGDLSKSLGAILWIGKVGSWSLNFDLGLSKPVIGTATHPEMDLAIASASSTGAGTLTITLSDTSFTALPKKTGVVDFSMGGTTTTVGGNTTKDTITGSASVNGTPVAGLGPLNGSSWSNSVLSSSTQFGSTFGLSETVVITHTTGKNVTAGDIELSVQPVPEPTSIIAGCLLLLPFGWSALRKLRGKSVPATASVSESVSEQ
jgi:hypothetical protein